MAKIAVESPCEGAGLIGLKQGLGMLSSVGYSAGMLSSVGYSAETWLGVEDLKDFSIMKTRCVDHT